LNEAELVLDEVSYRLRHYRQGRLSEAERLNAYWGIECASRRYEPLPLQASMLMLADILRAPFSAGNRFRSPHSRDPAFDFGCTSRKSLTA
jgi:hypothetical protein